MSRLTRVADQVKLTINNPERVTSLLTWGKVKALAFALVASTSDKRLQAPWQQTDTKFLHRRYRSYDEYIRHQVSKLKTIDLSDADVDYRAILRNRVLSLGYVEPGLAVLCLAARLGTEVKSFLDIGCFAVGVDLNPGKGNSYVLTGDFNSLVFADDSVDAIFFNSLDHCFDIDTLLKEMSRVLKPGGVVVFEIALLHDKATYYESFHWDSISEVVDYISKAGFAPLVRLEIDYPWPGEHVCFRSE